MGKTGKLPWMPFYTEDWRRDTRCLSPSTRGAWIDILCVLWPVGERTMPAQNWARELGLSMPEWEVVIEELDHFKIADIIATSSQACHAIVTVMSRRILRDSTTREHARKRQSSHRSHATVTPMSQGCHAVESEVIVRSHSQKPHLSSSSPVAAATSEETKKVKRVKSTSEGATLPALATSRSADTWEAYRRAYTERYQVEPVRNASVNAILLKFVGAVGQEEAPMIAAFYLQHNEAFYVKKRHPVSLLLHDATGLRTQWATGVKATTGEAKNAEFKDNVVEQVKRIEALRQGERT